MGMSSNDEPTLGELILAQVRGVESEMLLRPADFVKVSSHFQKRRGRPARWPSTSPATCTPGA